LTYSYWSLQSEVTGRANGFPAVAGADLLIVRFSSIRREVRVKRKSELFKVLVFVAVLLAAMLGISATAGAWSEGTTPSAVGTHDKLIALAAAVADMNRDGSADWLTVATAQAVSHYPDEVYRDTNNHIYDVWGLLRLGTAPTAVKSHYGKAVTALKAGDVKLASQEVGLMAHYYDDIWNPWHTTYEFSNLGTQALYHTRYETDVLTHEPASVKADGYNAVTDAATATKTAAGVSRGSYSAIATAYISGAGYTSAVNTVTQTMLTKAANGLADLITSIAVAAGR
jgi:hypothetical protein